MAGNKSIYVLENTSKYAGRDVNQIVCRSGWERAVCKFFDLSPTVVKWSSESVVVRYYNMLDNRYHRYFIDFAVETKEGKKFLIEIKPAVQTLPPRLPASGRETKWFNESKKTFVTNSCKWRAAQKYAEENGCVFAIWTEETLKKMGIQI